MAASKNIQSVACAKYETMYVISGDIVNPPVADLMATSGVKAGIKKANFYYLSVLSRWGFVFAVGCRPTA